MNNHSPLLGILSTIFSFALVWLIVGFALGKVKRLDSKGRPLGSNGPAIKAPRWQLFIGLAVLLSTMLLPAFVVVFEFRDLYFHPPLWLQMRLVETPIYFVPGAAWTGIGALFVLALGLGMALMSVVFYMYPPGLRDNLGGTTSYQPSTAVKVVLYILVPLTLALTSIAGLQSFAAFTDKGLVTNGFWQIHSSTLAYSDIASVHIGCKPTAYGKYDHKIYAVGITMNAVDKSGRRIDISPTNNPDQLDDKQVQVSAAADDIRQLKTRLQRENITLTRQACDSVQLPHFSQYQAARYSAYFILP